jgi:hypothetical protein
MMGGKSDRDGRATRIMMGGKSDRDGRVTRIGQFEGDVIAISIIRSGRGGGFVVFDAHSTHCQNVVVLVGRMNKIAVKKSNIQNLRHRV